MITRLPLGEGRGNIAGFSKAISRPRLSSETLELRNENQM